jgi:phosphosulfolactate synthase (CoM biosynthesis protein A)
MRIIWAFLPVKRFMADTENICYVDARTGAQEFNMAKDYKKYLFEGNIHCKRQLVKNVVENYINSHKNVTLEHLEKAFPSKIQQETKLKIASFDVIRKASDISDSDNRHYFKERISLADGTEIRINGGWDKDNIVAFIECARKLGYEIKEIEQGKNL